MDTTRRGRWRTGSAVDVLGHSHGGISAFGATALTSNIGKLVLYEGWPVPNPEAFALPPGVEERMDALLGEASAGPPSILRRRRT